MSITPSGVDIALTRANSDEWSGTFQIAARAVLEDLTSDPAPTYARITMGTSPASCTGQVHGVDGTDVVMADGQRVDLEDVVSVQILA